jgi:hypothetical protein
VWISMPVGVLYGVLTRKCYLLVQCYSEHVFLLINMMFI